MTIVLGWVQTDIHEYMGCQLESIHTGVCECVYLCVCVNVFICVYVFRQFTQCNPKCSDLFTFKQQLQLHRDQEKNTQPTLSFSLSH